MSKEQPKTNPQKNVNQFNRFLDNNQAFLLEKYQIYFSETFTISEIKQPNGVKQAVAFIYDIFSFGKYKSKAKLNATLQKSLQNNLFSFCDKLVGQKVSQNAIFTGDTAIELLRFCIQNNEMFAVHYDKKKPQAAPKPQEVVQKQQSNQEQLQKSQLPAQLQVKIQQQQEPQVPEPSPKVQEQKQQKKQKQPEQISCQNQFQINEQPLPKTQNLELIKKQLKNVFQFYCKQQQIIGPTFTFDNINHKCQTMDLGKFLSFAKVSGILHSKEKAYSQGKFQKKQLMAIYKKCAQGSRQINFNNFLMIMQEIKKRDQDLFIKLGLGQQGSKGHNKLLQKLKYYHLPFSTRDPEGRQKSPFGRPFVPQLTAHSGKIQSALRQQLINRKDKYRLQKLQTFETNEKKTIGMRRNSYNQSISQKQDQTKFTLKLGRQSDDMVDVQFLSKLIVQDDNDQVFLKQYHLPHRKNISRDRAGGKSFDQVGSRYTKQQNQYQVVNPFNKKAGGFTTRPNQRQEISLPLIQSRKKAAHLQRRSFNSRKGQAF